MNQLRDASMPASLDTSSACFGGIGQAGKPAGGAMLARYVADIDARVAIENLVIHHLRPQ
jgi:hypothetical protein